MDFHFRFNGTPLQHEEARALLQATKKDEKKSLTIDLEKIIDMKVLDSRKLFDIALKEKTPHLAHVAFQLGATTSTPARKRGRPPGSKNKVTKKVNSSIQDTPDQIIHRLHKSSSYWAAGVAAIILESSETEWITTREIATRLANKLHQKGNLPKDSLLYKGFIKSKGSLIPLDLTTKVDRSRTFHVSPLYLGIREGLIWCHRRGLIEHTTDVSTGARDKKKASNRGVHTSRVFYKIRATKKATEVLDLWADIDKYVESFYKTRKM